MKTLTAIILAGFLASACATTGGGLERSTGDKALARYEPYLEEPVDSFTMFRHDSWEPLNRNQLVLYTTMNDAYLLTVMGPCYELPFAQTVGVAGSYSPDNSRVGISRRRGFFNDAGLSSASQSGHAQV